MGQMQKLHCETPRPILGKWWKFVKYDNSVKLLPKDWAKFP